MFRTTLPLWSVSLRAGSGARGARLRGVAQAAATRLASSYGKRSDDPPAAFGTRMSGTDRSAHGFAALGCEGVAEVGPGRDLGIANQDNRDGTPGPARPTGGG